MIKKKKKKLFVCDDCGCEGYGFHLHHRNGDHYDNDPKNLQILCPYCHGKISSDQRFETNHVDALDMITNRFLLEERLRVGFALLSDDED